MVRARGGEGGAGGVGDAGGVTAGGVGDAGGVTAGSGAAGGCDGVGVAGRVTTSPRSGRYSGPVCPQPASSSAAAAASAVMGDGAAIMPASVGRRAGRASRGSRGR